MNVTSVDGTPRMNPAQCTCTTDPDGQINTDGCVLDDLVVVGVFVGEDDQ